MDVERERAVLRLVEEALELAPAEREGHIAACEDRAVASAALDLLGRETAGELPELDVPPDVVGGFDPLLAADGFEVVRPLGAGGMGRVFEARQKSPERRVALKTLRAGLDTELARRRFAYEADVLASLRHPGIAQVYAVGTFRERTLGGERDVPYFAMEYVEDARDVVAFAHHEELGREARLRLFLEACDAVQHGHDRGVLHRDLKPSNILVGADGRVKVIDFGIARPVVARAPVDGTTGTAPPRTLTGALYGTPSSLSPEQLGDERDVDVRADVYALGVLLYRLVCGAPPHDLEGLPLHRVARIVLENEPRRPSQLAPDVPRDLEAVLLRSVARERAARYPSVAALADDVRRFLASEPVAARVPSAAHQLRLLAKRHRFAFAAATVALIAVVAGAAGATFFALRAGAQARRAETASQQQAAAREELFEIATAFVFDYADRIAAMPGSLEVRAELMRRGIADLDNLAELPGADAEDRLRLAYAYLHLGDVLGAPGRRSLGDLSGAEQAYGRAREIAADLADDELELELLERDGQLAFGRGDVPAAASTLAEIAARMRALGDERRADLAEALSSLGGARGVAGDHEGAHAAFAEARELRAALLELEPGSQSARSALARSTAQLGTAAARAGRAGDAIDAYESAIAMLDALCAESPTDVYRESARVETGVAFGKALLELERTERAEAVARETLALADAAERRDPENATLTRFRGDALFDLARALERRAREAEPPLRPELLREARDTVRASRDAFATLASEGKLLPRETGYFAILDEKLATLDDALSSP